MRGKAFHYNHQNVGTGSCKKAVEAVGLSDINHLYKQRIGCGLRHKAVLLAEILLFCKRFHKTECRICRSMIQPHIAAEIYLSYIHCRYRESSADWNEKQSGEQNKHSRRKCLTAYGFQRLAKQAVNEQQIKQCRIYKEYKHSAYDCPYAHARQRIFWGREEIEQRRCIKSETPVFIQTHINCEYGRQQHRDNAEVYFSCRSKPFPVHENRHYQHQCGQCRKITRERGVELKSM